MSTSSFPQLSASERTAIKRSNGQMSCAECSRLKLKCDKTIPCSSCIRRHCEAVCPNGTLPVQNSEKKPVSPGPSSQVARAPRTEDLISRIIQLEDALAILQPSSSKHPLLREDLIRIKFGDSPVEDHSSTDLKLSNALGTLTVDENGQSRYFGPSAGSESLMLRGGREAASEFYQVELDATSKIAEIAQGFPFSSAGTLSFDVLKSLMPPKFRAFSLCETFFQQGSWSAIFIVSREEIIDLLTPAYSQSAYNQKNLSPHSLALLLLVLALGALVDLTSPADSDEADQLYQLAIASLSHHSIFSSGDLETVHALLMLSIFHLQGGRRYSLDDSWTFATLASKKAQALGLHRNNAFPFEDSIIQRRRRVFWTAVFIDTWLSLTLGRPPTIRHSDVDCPLPIDEDETVDEHGTRQMGLEHWRYHFVKTILSEITERLVNVTGPSYATVQALDARIRVLRSRHKVDINADDFDEDVTPTVFMRRYAPLFMRASAALFLHRSFFAKALLESPDPLASPYANSVFISYRCAAGILTLYMKYFSKFPALMLRSENAWGSLFSAALIMGSIVVRAPASHLAPKAFMELGLAFKLFEQGAPHSKKARAGMIILTKLMKKAAKHFATREDGGGVVHTDALVLDEDFDEELQIFAGRTNVILSKFLNSRTIPADFSTSESSFDPKPAYWQAAPNPQIIDIGFDTDAFLSESRTGVMMPLIFGNESSGPMEVDFTETDDQSAINAQWLSFMKDSGYLDQPESSFLENPFHDQSADWLNT
ncbi:fungal-specific transcription factor domain-containing protein [Mycena floridula]|nr:fungal-specific transcription factor domain-containing protein [Mycena floridula]